jgi:hypothetical protein
VPLPPVLELYQNGEPPAQLAVKVAVKPEQIVLLAAVGGFGVVFTVTAEAFVLVLSQPPTRQAA